ncbi:hypothetical protein OOK41_24520 [Micromonospora sp. NBC_01655]|uniref:hypothetical protein n=1 Tax=Micromonospora sp. NBC_01655 TaxID=2975983 RepID=UPI002257D136|nr:hypothetical protein [Micromonospora sp. NBC_01655]MCX4473432.1 hypothetical protein [Micromonospora sp. NBC_01655]
MLSVAPTCPLWWVARWTARMLTSLAVAVAFSLGAGSLSFDAVSPAGAAAAGVPAAAWSPAGSPPVLGAPDPGPVGPGRAAVDTPAAPAHTDAVPAGPAGWSVVHPAPAHRMPLGPAPATAGSRAPPRG